MAPARETDMIASFRDPRTALGPGDIVVVGAGLAGLFTALKLAPHPVTIVAAAPLGEGASSVWAQGGIAAAVGLGDTPEAHARDTIAAGGGIVDEAVANIVAAEAPERIRDLLAYGVPFDRDLEGHFVLSREAAHSTKRIVRVSGDRAGAAIMQALIAAVRATPSIRVLERFVAEDLIIEDERVVGVRLNALDGRGQAYDFLPASAVVLATGGIGALYAVTTNPAYARGEAMAFAARAGAVIADAEFVQFHPTAIDVGGDPAPLATEALRGEGAILVNRAGKRFMPEVDPAAELAARDVVARAVFAEIAAGRGAFLDCRRAIGRRFADAYPTVYAHCRKAGIDPATDLIPIAPAAHYHMGGIATDIRGRTSVEGLWAAGEVASTGLHGANRLASNSLLEAVVFGHRVAADIRELVSHEHASPVAKTFSADSGPRLDARDRDLLIRRLRATMSEHAGVVRDGRGLRLGLEGLRAIADEGAGDRTIANMALAAQLVAAAALDRRESRGAHFRSDFPASDPGPGKRSVMTLKSLKAIGERAASAAPASRVAELSL